VLREGPIPATVHGLLEYAVGLLLVAAPVPLQLRLQLGDRRVGGARGAAPRLAAASRMPTGLVGQISNGVHVTVDLGLVLVLVAAPFVLGVPRRGGAAQPASSSSASRTCS
jgi:hypothetical protein